jgi:hypothetical protein
MGRLENYEISARIACTLTAIQIMNHLNMSIRSLNSFTIRGNTYCNGFEQRVARKQLCKHSSSRNNRMNVYRWLLGDSAPMWTALPVFPFWIHFSSWLREIRFIVAGSAVAVPKLPELDMGYPSNTRGGWSEKWHTPSFGIIQYTI